MELRFFLDRVGPYRRYLLLIALASVSGSLFTLAVPWLAGQLMGGIVVRQFESLTLILTLLVGALVAMTLAGIAAALISNLASARILADMRAEIHAHILRLPMSFHDHQEQGDLLALMTYEVARLGQFLTATLATIPSALLTTVGSVVILFTISPKLALLVPVLVPAFYLALKVIGRRLRSFGQRRQQAEAKVMAAAEQHLELVSAVKAFTRETAQDKRYADVVDEARVAGLEEDRLLSVLGPLIGLAVALAAVLLVSLASQTLQAGALTPAGLFSFLLYVALLTRPVGTLANVYGQIQSARGTLLRLRTVLDVQVEAEGECRAAAHADRNSISFERVAFSYAGSPPTLDDVTFAIGDGEIVALTGANGAGKSTLVKLLLRFYLPDRGRISLGGVDIGELPLAELRSRIGYVPQRPLLFSGTIRENIAFGAVAADQSAIEQAALTAQAMEFITNLPNGFDTRIGDHGVRISGGQGQRIALARALLKDPPILVFDEATSMYDFEGEAAFIETCKTALSGRTVILITHRPASLALARRILRVAEGCVFEEPREVVSLARERS